MNFGARGRLAAALGVLLMKDDTLLVLATGQHQRDKRYQTRILQDANRPQVHGRCEPAGPAVSRTRPWRAAPRPAFGRSLRRQDRQASWLPWN